MSVGLGVHIIQAAFFFGFAITRQDVSVLRDRFSRSFDFMEGFSSGQIH